MICGLRGSLFNHLGRTSSRSAEVVTVVTEGLSTRMISSDIAGTQHHQASRDHRRQDLERPGRGRWFATLTSWCCFLAPKSPSGPAVKWLILGRHHRVNTGLCHGKGSMSHRSGISPPSSRALAVSDIQFPHFVSETESVDLPCSGTRLPRQGLNACDTAVVLAAVATHVNIWKAM